MNKHLRTVHTVSNNAETELYAEEVELSGSDGVELSGSEGVELSSSETVEKSGRDGVEQSGREVDEQSGGDEVEQCGSGDNLLEDFMFNHSHSLLLPVIESEFSFEYM